MSCGRDTQGVIHRAQYTSLYIARHWWTSASVLSPAIAAAGAHITKTVHREPEFIYTAAIQATGTVTSKGPHAASGSGCLERWAWWSVGEGTVIAPGGSGSPRQQCHHWQWHPESVLHWTTMGYFHQNISFHMQFHLDLPLELGESTVHRYFWKWMDIIYSKLGNFWNGLMDA